MSCEYHILRVLRNLENFYYSDICHDVELDVLKQVVEDLDFICTENHYTKYYL